MKKLKRVFDVDYNLNWMYGVTLAQLKEDIAAIEKLGATHVEIELEDRWDCPYISIQAKSERVETDEERKSREEREKQIKEKQIQKEIEEFERLKIKLGKL